MPSGALPALDVDGFLPPGLHAVEMDVIRSRFGQFSESDRRPRLLEKLVKYVEVARQSRLVVELIINGSFVTVKAMPEDIDLVVVVRADHEFAADLGPDAYNALSKRRCRRLFGLDILVAPEHSGTLDRWVDFFSQVKGQPGRKKGVLRLSL